MSGANERKGNGHRWRTVTARLRAEGRGCWICREFGRPDAIDYALPPGHPMSFSADHLVPVARGGALYDIDNLDAAHLRCNEWRRDRSVAEVMAIARRSPARRRMVVASTGW